jgi:hypothetical protein
MIRRDRQVSEGDGVTDQTEVMHLVRVKGFAEAADVADVLGADADHVRSILDDLHVAGLAKHRDGRVSGWSLTGEGREEHLRLAAADPLARDPRIESAYRVFLPLNERFKVLCTEWQLEDHPRRCVEHLEQLHREASPMLAGLTDAAARFASYRRRLDQALARLQRGDDTALTRPLSGSYHDVWMELHQDLLLTQGRERSTADGH